VVEVHLANDIKVQTAWVGEENAEIAREVAFQAVFKDMKVCPWADTAA
jgi:hypothetical protein